MDDEMTARQVLPRVGRILTSAEREQRQANETARTLPGEVRRSGFAISDRHLLTAWHCVREPLASHHSLWFRLRDETTQDRQYYYLPLRVTNYDERLDVAALAVDRARLGEVDLTASEARAVLAAAAIPVTAEIHVNDRVQVIGFPESASGADSDTNGGDIVATALPFGDVTGLKVFCSALAAVDPVKPRGLSGGPVLRIASDTNGDSYVAVGLIRSAPIGSLPRTASGGSLVASRVEDIATQLPEVAVLLPTHSRWSSMPNIPAATRGLNLHTLSASCSRALTDTVVEFNDPMLGTLTGWSHFLHESLNGTRPTAIGTAYGLKLTLIIDEKHGKLNRSALAETLWKLRRADGGWSARTQGRIGRAEVTALVLGALSSAGYDQNRIDEAGLTFEDSLSMDNDPVGMATTWVVSSAMRSLALTHPTSRRLPELRRMLLAGAIQDPDQGNLLCWSHHFSPKRNQILVPSVAHTAHAVVALARAAQVLGEDASSRSAVEQSIRWLASRPTLTNQAEQIRREVTDDHQESLIVHHFTAAWVAHAIMTVSPDYLTETDTLLEKSIQHVWNSQRDGIWEWEDLDRPIWMSYQGIRALRNYAFRSLAAAG